MSSKDLNDIFHKTSMHSANKYLIDTGWTQSGEEEFETKTKAIYYKRNDDNFILVGKDYSSEANLSDLDKLGIVRVEYQNGNGETETRYHEHFGKKLS
ncbi:hypothetical protein [Tunicatimonas pelagia]|uniref:hypothetical protein n=1 Tax=Tunicatimonas pelagia TaxID=931531 RepID=UPI002665440A|nr:hypothetical protein [Tunicatimonas pelagia]WKN44240.1 hypothetical protein P0M28_04575 [Tunicatimonas pelagia]